MSVSFYGRPPDPLNLQAKDMSQELKIWLTNFEDYVALASKKFTPEQMKALLLNCGGLELRRLTEGLTLDPKMDVYDGLKHALMDYFCPKKSTVYERYMFRRRVQHEGEKICQFVTNLRSIARGCGFDDTSYETVENQNIRDQFICGLASPEIRKRLLAETHLTLKKAVEVAQAIEEASAEVKNMVTGVQVSENVGHEE
jgi:hypothetical protein